MQLRYELSLRKAYGTSGIVLITFTANDNEEIGKASTFFLKSLFWFFFSEEETK